MLSLNLCQYNRHTLHCMFVTGVRPRIYFEILVASERAVAGRAVAGRVVAGRAVAELMLDGLMVLTEY